MLGETGGVVYPMWSRPGKTYVHDFGPEGEVYGGGVLSKIVQKSYKEGRISFQGTEQDVIWLDEEPPLDIYAECLLRTMTTDGLVLCTFTPMEGMTEVVMLYLQDGKIPESGVIYSDSTKITLEA